eukprot:CAMPEP_0197286484 /NCGR_PEP_ID=MMETSP0890-20130614/1884_1 /TAXON_ID=44058 ORGANISM="Aureoumbra lagunensis, Strain CCMP1510" /NCGR_SAMPLE_ID=MMETSP0890 /ASSEMBLY_ACC=CAM_ASM_000533 /LENGTH=450 /DNA_ID=CAMNT_0042754825 /DNA_START=141 /DNA_END=1493 /DNA_ORIENTATION=+
MLRSIFGHFGPIVDIRLVSGPGNGPYAFVDFSTELAAEAAMSMDGQEFDGRRLRVERAKKADYPPALSAATAPESRAEVYVGNIAPSTPESELRAYFENFGQVSEIQMVKDRTTGQFRGFAFVRFHDQDSAQAAVAKAPHNLYGRILNVAASNLAKNKDASASPRSGGPQPVLHKDAVLPVRVKTEPIDNSPHRRDSADYNHFSDRGKRMNDPNHSGGPEKRPRFIAQPLPSYRSDDDRVALAVDHLYEGSIKLAEYANKVEKDTRATCSAFGEVASVKVAVPRVVSPQPVFVEFRSGIHAAAAAENLASRTYDGRQLVVRRLTRQELLSEIEDFYLRSQSTTAPPQPPIPLKSNGSARHFQDQLEDTRRQLERAQDDREKRETEKARLRADLAHHAAQHKLLQARVDELEDELDKARASAKKDREYHAARVKALTERTEALEAERDNVL